MFVGVLNGRSKELPRPAYPVGAMPLEKPITVAVEVVIDITGRVESARARGGAAELRAAAESAARRALFMPFYAAGRPVRAHGTINYTFEFMP
jgi:outer membrane biosynthesis protein TonB